MILECVTVCVGYADFLAVTARRNAPLFDRWVIATTPGDTETREVCRKHGLQVLLTEELYRDGAAFNKGRAVELALDQVEGADWLLHLDADIVLPPDLRNWLPRADLDPTCIYGFDRALVRSWEQWSAFAASGHLDHDYHCRCNFPPGLEVGTRWTSPRHGYVPIGFGQLWHGSADTGDGYHQKPYPAHHGSAARSDVQFALQWDRRKRLLLPEVIAIHLESGPAALGANWAGRTTPRFGPPAACDHNPPPGSY